MNAKKILSEDFTLEKSSQQIGFVFLFYLKPKEQRLKSLIFQEKFRGDFF